MRVNLQVLGCRLNEAELQQWAHEFQVRGHEITAEVEQADLLVVNSCAVTGEAGRKSRQLIRRAQRNNPQAKLVVSGCYATLEAQQTAAIEGVDLVVLNQDKDQLVDKIEQALQFDTMPVLAQRPAETALFRRGRSRAFIKVQDGCRWRCSYCIVTIARGEERSTPQAQIIEQINQHAAQGVKEIVLTGVHLGGYGSDIDSSLYELTQAVLRETDIPRIRFGSLEPWDLQPGFFELFEDPRLMPHLHLPLQSGSDSVLKHMSRRCKTQDFADLVTAARKSIADFNVTTDIIVGFPGETDAEWQQSMEFIKSVGFGHTHIFSFSPRAGTKAAGMANPVPANVIKQRSADLHTLAEHMKQAYMAHLHERKFAVLLEEKMEPQSDGRYRYLGYTPNYSRVTVDLNDADNGNRILTLKTILKEDHLQACLAV